MVFTPVRTERKPPGTDRVLNWAAYGLYQDQNYHLLSAKEVADKKILDSATSKRRDRASPKGKEIQRQYAASEVGKETRRQYASSEVGKESQRKSAARQGEQGTKRARVLLEKFDNGSRPAVQQKTNEPQMGCLAALLGGSY